MPFRSASLAAPGRLTLATLDLDAPPMFWAEPDGTRRGYEVDVAAAAAEVLGLEVRWSPLRWAELLPALERGTCDAVWACQAILPERRTTVDFTVPYGVFDEAVMVPSESDVAAPEDLRGKRVGAIVASSNMALLETFPGAVPVAFEGTSGDVLAEMADAVRAGELDAFVDDEQVLQAYERLWDDLRIAFACPTRIPYGVAIRKDSPDLRDALDGALGSLAAAGRLEQIWRRWFPDAPSFAGDLDRVAPHALR